MSKHELTPLPCPHCDGEYVPHEITMLGQGTVTKWLHPVNLCPAPLSAHPVRGLVGEQEITLFNRRPREAALQEKIDDLTAALNEAGELLDQCNGWHPNVQNAIDVIAAALSVKAEAAE